MNMTRIEQIVVIAESAIVGLSPVGMETEEDKAYAAEVVRQTKDGICAYQRTGWQQKDYRLLRRITGDLAWLKIGQRDFNDLPVAEKEKLMAGWAEVMARQNEPSSTSTIMA